VSLNVQGAVSAGTAHPFSTFREKKGAETNGQHEMLKNFSVRRAKKEETRRRSSSDLRPSSLSGAGKGEEKYRGKRRKCTL